MIIDIFLAVFFSIIAIHYTATAVGLKLRDGKTRIHYGDKGSRSWWIRWIFNIFRASILGLAIIRLFIPSVDAHILFTYELPYHSFVRGAGAALMLVSLFMISYVHAYMRDQWHSGIDNNVVRNFNTLSQGPFAVCRHPLFSSVMIGMLGFYFALPSLFTFISLLIGVTCLIIQANHEEQRLSHVQSYQAYKMHTRKWPVSLRIRS